MGAFFPTQLLTLEQKRDILRNAKERCREWWADVLDCSKSFRRQRIDASFEDMMARLDERSHFVIIHRNSCGDDYLEVGFSTMASGPDYFLWIILDPAWIDKLQEIGYPT